MNAYSEKYLNDAMRNLGEAFSYALCCCNMQPDEFAHLFISSGVADYYGKGNPKYVVGKSGTELATDIIESSGESMVFPKPQIEYEYYEEYWAGWILAFYQWKSGRTYRDILINIWKIEGLNNRLLFISAFDIYIAIITNIIKTNLSCINNIN